MVLIRARVHPFPSRTRKLSSLLLTILGWRRPGKIGSANTSEGQSSDCPSFLLCNGNRKDKDRDRDIIMARSETVILTNMCMLYDREGNILVQDRLDPGWPGVTFPGGHVEPGESFTGAVIREIREETGLTIEAPQLCGLKQFWEDDGTRYIVILYKTDRFSGEVRSSSEGKVFWIKRSELLHYPLAESFEEMLRVFEEESVGEMYSHWEDGAFKRELL